MYWYHFSSGWFKDFFFYRRLPAIWLWKCLDMFSSCFLSFSSSWICGCKVLPPQAIFWNSHCTYISLLYIVPRPTGAVLFLKVFLLCFILDCYSVSSSSFLVQVVRSLICYSSPVFFSFQMYFLPLNFQFGLNPIRFSSHPAHAFPLFSWTRRIYLQQLSKCPCLLILSSDISRSVLIDVLPG